MLPFTKDELTGIVRWAMRKTEIADLGEAFVQAVAELMFETMCTLERGRNPGT